MSEPTLQHAPETIDCPVCYKIARYQGTQDWCDVYVCADDHLTRVSIRQRPKEPA